MPSNSTNLSIRQTIAKVNANWLKLRQDEFIRDYSFGISSRALGTTPLESLSYYIADQAIEMQYIPGRLEYVGFEELGEEGGTHRFTWKCEDRSTKNLMNFLTRMNTLTNTMEITEEEFRVFQGFASHFSHTVGTNISIWRGLNLLTPRTI